MPAITEHYATELADLQHAYRSGDLNLYLGAGVPAASGLPNWKQLVVSMYFRYMNIEQWQSIRPFPNYLYATGEWYLNKTGESLDIIIRKLKTNLPEYEFLKILYDCLYNHLNESGVENPYTTTSASNMVLMEIANLLSQPDRKVNSVVTYNFDDLLEQALEMKRVDYTSVFNMHTLPVPGSLPVYHPHGFMPFANSFPTPESTGNIIYPKTITTPLQTATTIGQTCCKPFNLPQGTGLMIGLSFSDRNLRRLIDLIANIPLHTNNYIFLKKNTMPRFTKKDSDEIKKKADSIVHKMLESGIKMENKAYGNCQHILSELFRMDEETTNRVFEQMRIKPIWISDYQEIPVFLKAIRNPVH